MKMQNIVWTNTNSPGKVQQNFDDIKDIKDGKGSINYYNAEFYVSVLNQGHITPEGVEIFDDMHIQTEISPSGDNISYQNYYSQIMIMQEKMLQNQLLELSQIDPKLAVQAIFAA